MVKWVIILLKRYEQHYFTTPTIKCGSPRIHSYIYVVGLQGAPDVKKIKVMLDKKCFKSGYGVSRNSEIANKEKNDCVVRAIANVFEVSYNAAHQFSKLKLNRKDRRGAINVREEMMSIKEAVFQPEGQLNLFDTPTERKFTIKHMGDMPKLDGDLINPKYKHKPVAYTVKTFMQNFKRGSFLILVNKHALTIKNGVVIDNANYRFDGYRRPVESAFKILG
tara:strand:- start:125 stop:787 length:663 start_codon:yes stop_codon:yes gene_type:complete